MTAVAIDCRTLQDRPVGGVGRALVGMLPHVAAAIDVDVLVDDRLPEPLGVPTEVPVHALRAPLSRRGFAWLQGPAPRWLRGYKGVFHCPFYGLPYRQPAPMVVTIHDLTFEFTSWYSAASTAVFRRQARWAARTARWIFVPSEHVREDLLARYERFGATPERVSVLRQPVSPAFAPGRRDGHLLDRLDIQTPYVVALGGTARRQLDVAVASWAHARDDLGAAGHELPLVVVGPEAPPSLPGVIHAGALDDAQWAAVLTGAAAFCYPTLYEGYGMPALEAAASGTPIVCARVGSLPEVLGDAAAWCERPVETEMAAALTALLLDSERSTALRAAGLAQARAVPSWPAVAQVALDGYRAAALE